MMCNPGKVCGAHARAQRSRLALRRFFGLGRCGRGLPSSSSSPLHTALRFAPSSVIWAGMVTFFYIQHTHKGAVAHYLSSHPQEGSILVALGYSGYAHRLGTSLTRQSGGLLRFLLLNGLELDTCWVGGFDLVSPDPVLSQLPWPPGVSSLYLTDWGTSQHPIM